MTGTIQPAQPYPQDGLVAVVTETSREVRIVNSNHPEYYEDSDVREGRIMEDEAERRPPSPALNWETFLTADLGDVDWHAGKVVARGDQVSLVGQGKAGKSLFALELAWRMSAGLPFLGDIARPPCRVMYVDRENSMANIQERLLSFGATPEELKNLIYVLHPPYGPLDTKPGGEALLYDAQGHDAEAVVLDTISRFIVGKENDSDTWLALYRYSLMRLKSRNISCVRLDHFGKDADRGSRGSSAKNQDVDTVWELTQIPGHQILLNRTHSRSGHGQDRFDLIRTGQIVDDRWLPGASGHILSATPRALAAAPTTWVIEDRVREVAEKLNAAGVPLLGRTRLREHCRDLRIEVSDLVLSHVIKYRRENS